MAKKSRKSTRSTPPRAGEVGPRQPCPCGSGKRYKACHGAEGGAAAVFVGRPFEGLPSECDIVAMRELVPGGDGAADPDERRRLGPEGAALLAAADGRARDVPGER